MSKYKFSVGDEVNGYRFLGGDSTNQNNWEPVSKLAQEMTHEEDPQQRDGLGGIASSFGRGLLSTVQMPATMAWNMAATPSHMGAKAVGFSPPPLMTGMELPEAAGMQAPQTRGERFAELAGASAIPGAGTVGLAARTGRAVPTLATLATELASLGGAHVGEEIGGTPGMVAGGLLPFGAGGVLRQVSGAAPRLGSRQAQQRILGAFERQGIPATIGDITDIAYPQRAASTLPGGYGLSRRLRAEQASAMGRRVEEITGGRAADLEPDVAGAAIQKGMEGWIARDLRGTAGKIDRQLKALVPADTPTFMTDTKAVLDKMITEAGPFSKQLVHPSLAGIAKIVDRLEAGGGMSFQQMLDVRSAIGRKLSSPSIVSDIPRWQLKQVYGALSRDLERTGSLVGGDRAVQLFARRNRHWSKGMERVEKFLEPILKKNTPEEAFVAIQKTTERGPTRIRAIAKTLDKEQKEIVIGTMLRNMGEPIPSLRSVEYSFSPETFATNLNKVDTAGWYQLTRGTRYGNLQHLKDLRLVASRLREVDKVLKNPSGTSYATLAGAAGMVTAGGVALGRPIEALSVLGTTTGGSWAVAKLMSSPSVVHWIAQGAKMPASQAAGHLARLNLSMAENAEVQQALGAFMGTLTQ